MNIDEVKNKDFINALNDAGLFLGDMGLQLAYSFTIRDSRITFCFIFAFVKKFPMKKHNGMRPHDIVVLLKIASKGKQSWFMKDLASELQISASEISESIHRSIFAGLISGDKKTLKKLALLEFLKSGLKYVFPQQPGPLVRGLETAHSAPPLKNLINSEDYFVWPYVNGKTRGQAIEPLHPRIPDACLEDDKFYEMMALVDALRTGKAREHALAAELLKERIENA